MFYFQEEDEEEEEDIPLDLEEIEAVSKKARQDEEIHSEHMQVNVNNFSLSEIGTPRMGSLFRNKRFMLDEMTWQNASKFTIFLECENLFHFVLYFIFFPKECPDSWSMST